MLRETIDKLIAAGSATSQERGRLEATDGHPAASVHPPSREKELALTTEPRFLRIGDVARLTGCTPQTVRVWVERGVIPPEAVFRAMKRGRFLFRAARLLAWIDSRSGASAAPGGKAEGA